MRFPRFRLWMLLTVVALAGLSMKGWQLWERRQLCLARARQHEASRDFHLASGSQPRARMHDGLAAEYRRAADNPWLPLPREFVW